MSCLPNYMWKTYNLRTLRFMWKHKRYTQFFLCKSTISLRHNMQTYLTKTSNKSDHILKGCVKKKLKKSLIKMQLTHNFNSSSFSWNIIQKSNNVPQNKHCVDIILFYALTILGHWKRMGMSVWTFLLLLKKVYKLFWW